MRKTLAAVLVLAVIGAAVWSGLARREPAPAAAAAAEAQDRYNFEAQGVVLRQLDPEGKLQYEIEAERIVQLADGDVEATKLTFNHEPAGATGRAPRSWTLTANAGTFPAAGGTVHLDGGVRALGSRAGSGTPLIITAARLNYDLKKEVVCAEGNVEARDGGIYARSQGACVNVATGRLTVESGNGKISL